MYTVYEYVYHVCIYRWKSRRHFSLLLCFFSCWRKLTLVSTFSFFNFHLIHRRLHSTTKTNVLLINFNEHTQQQKYNILFILFISLIWIFEYVIMILYIFLCVCVCITYATQPSNELPFVLPSSIHHKVHIHSICDCIVFFVLYVMYRMHF